MSSKSKCSLFVLGTTCSTVSTQGLALGPLAENIISHQDMVMTASCGYKVYISMAVVQYPLSQLMQANFLLLFQPADLVYKLYFNYFLIRF